LKKTFQILLNLFPRPLLIQLSLIIKPLLVLVYKGTVYKDPIDGKTFSKFLAYGYEKQRPNVLSPSTLSLERHRLLWLYLQWKTDFFTRPQKLLHFAPEQAFFKRFKDMENLEYTTTDLNSPIADVKADICDLPFEDNSFDTLICNHVLEHIKDDTKAMKELLRVLKPGGMAILQIPQDLSRASTFEDNSITDPKDRAKIFGQYDHLRIYGCDYFDKLREIGFHVEEVDLTSELTNKEVDYFRLSKGEILPICVKPSQNSSTEDSSPGDI
jgi:predicted SAM-dependent methyltransferase